MELHTRRHSQYRPLGQEKHPMLNLNCRLETYLGRVKLLEEENELLRQEVQHLRGCGRGAFSRRQGLDNELLEVRLEVEAAWREKVKVEMEIGSLDEELRVLSLQRQREADAHGEAKKRMAESKKDMEEEKRAQLWLKEKVRQLEIELHFQIQTHKEDVAHVQEMLTHARPVLPPMPAQASTQLFGLQDLGEEYSQGAARVWQEAAEAYQGQVARLEESLTQARTRLEQVEQEKHESQKKLQALEGERASAQDLKLFLEARVVQQRGQQHQDIQQLQAHLEALEVEKEELGLQIDELLINHRGLLQLKMSLGLEVATYRALLDNESHTVGVSKHQPRNTSNPDSRGVKQSLQTQKFSGHMNSALSSIPAARPKSKITSTFIPKRVTHSKTHIRSLKAKEEQVDFSKTGNLTPAYPKVLQDAVHQFRPQDVREEVSHAEPLSSANEDEAEVDVESWVGLDQKEALTEDREEGEDLTSTGPLEIQPVVSISHKVQSNLFGQPSLSVETEEHTSPTENLVTEYPVIKSEGPQRTSQKEEPQPELSLSPNHAWTEEDLGTESKEAAWMNNESSESETEAVMEPTYETSTSSPASESQAEESMFNPQTEFEERDNPCEETGTTNLTQTCQDSKSLTNEEQLDDKLYSDGDEMDAWDQVIERKAHVENDIMNVEKDESQTQHVTLEERLSPSEHEENVSSSVAAQDSFMTPELIHTNQSEKKDLEEEKCVNLSDKAQTVDDDSPNASISWRTELGSDSYALDDTLADTRPLIRYKSDETDANTQTSHMDESESSDVDEGRMVGGAGTGAWGSKCKRFGTMEDLCEETSGETLDEEYNREDTHTEDMSAGQPRECLTLGGNEHETGQMISRDNEELSDEETEELTEREGSTSYYSEDYNEDSVDRIVEQELEVLSISTYSTQFQQKTAEVTTASEQTECTKSKARGLLQSEGLEQIDSEKASSTHPMHLNEPYEFNFVEKRSVDMKQVKCNVFQEDMAVDREVENLSTLDHVVLTEDDSGNPDNLSERQDNINHSDSSDDDQESSNASQCSQPIARVKYADPEDLEGVEVSLNMDPPSEEPISGLQEHPMEHYSWNADQEHPQTEEWAVLESPSKHLQSKELFVDHSMYTTNIHPEFVAQGEGREVDMMESLDSPDRMPHETNIFQVQNSEDLSTTKNTDLHSFISSGMHDEFWTSPGDTGATYQTDVLYESEAEISNQNLAFSDSKSVEYLENPKVANSNTQMEPDIQNAPLCNREQEKGLPLAKQQLCGDVVEGEDSEGEGDSWSSGEEYE